MRFRGTRADPDRRAIASEYAQAVDQLIDSSGWQKMPGPEDHLPDAWMPQAFFDYWSGRSGTP